MKRLSNFVMYSLSQVEARRVMGGLRVGEATATCNNGETISCSGAGSCTSQDGGGVGKPDGYCTCGGKTRSCDLA